MELYIRFGRTTFLKGDLVNKNIALISASLIVVAWIAVGVFAQSNSTTNKNVAWPAIAMNMTQAQKNLAIQVLTIQDKMVNDKIAYLNGTLTYDQLTSNNQANLQSLAQLRNQTNQEIRTNIASIYPGMMGRGNHIGWAKSGVHKPVAS